MGVLFLGTQVTSLMLDLKLLLSPHEIPIGNAHALMLFPSACLLFKGQMNSHELNLSWKAVGFVGAVIFAVLINLLDSMYMMLAIIFTPVLFEVILRRARSGFQR